MVDVVFLEVSVAVAVAASVSERADIHSNWRIPRFKRKLHTSGEIYEFRYKCLIVITP